MKVEHAKFGFGVVKEIDASTNDRKARIFLTRPARRRCC
jgi:hypothetical protein